MLPAIRQGGIHANQSTSYIRFRGSSRKSGDDKVEMLPENCSISVGMRKIIEWFNSWTASQQRFLLCGMTERLVTQLFLFEIECLLHFLTFLCTYIHVDAARVN